MKPDLNLHSYSPVIADLNDDGRMDHAVLVALPSGVNVLYGNDNGTFGSEITVFAAFMINSGSLNSLVAGDFNNDHKLDFAFANYDEDYVRVLLGNGNETFCSTSDVFDGNW